MAKLDDVFKFNPHMSGSIDENKAADANNIIEYWQVILRQKKYVFYSVFLILIIGLPMIYALTPIYSSTAKVVVDTDQTKLVGLEVEGGGLDFKVNTEVEIIKSNKVHLRTIRQLQLWNAVDFNEVSLGQKILLLFAIQDTQKAAQKFRKYNDLSGQDIAEYLRELGEVVAVSRTRGTNVIEISALSASANRAADIANSITRSYLTEKVESKANSIREAADILRVQLDRLSADIQNYENQIENFIQAQSAKVLSPAVRDELEKLRLEIASKMEVKLARGLQLAQLNRAAVAQDYLLISDLSTDPKIGSLYMRFEAVNERLTAPSLSADDKFNLEQELQKIDDDFTDVTLNLSQQLSVGIDDTQARIEQVRMARQKLFSEQNLPQDVSLALYRLATDIASKRNLYEIESVKYSEVEQKIGILISELRVIATAFPSAKPVKPNKWLLAVGLLAFSIFAGLLVAAIRDRLIGGFTSAEQVRSVLGFRPMSVIPNHKGADEDNVILNQPLSRFSESIRMLQVGLDNHQIERGAGQENLARVIAVTSTVPQEGKTTIALSLARIYALAGKKTILVDLDFRHPVVQDRLGLETAYGLQDFIREDAKMATLEKIMHHEAETGLDVVLSGMTDKTATDILIQSPLLELILKKFKAEYDIVIFDTPPVGLLVDAQIIAKKADQMVYAIKHAATRQKNVLTGISFIHSANEALPISIVITQQDDAQASFYGMHGAEYSYYYGG